MKQKKSHLPFFPLCAGIFVLLGILILLGLHGFSFSAYCCFGAAGVIVCYLLLGRLGKKHPKCAKVLRMLLTIFLCIALLAALITGFFIARSAVGDTTTQYEYVIVLGAGVNGTVPSMSLRERIDAAAQYLKDHPDTICVVSGGKGNGEQISEADCMYRELTAQGIDGSRIWREDKSTSTKENFAFSLNLIEQKTGSRPQTAAVVSSGYHLFRASLIAGHQGLTIAGVPAQSRWLALYVNYFLREIIAVWYHLIIGG